MLRDLVHDARGRDRDSALGNRDAVWARQQAGRLHHGAQVEQGLAHSHHHDVEGALGGVQRLVPRDCDHLRDDFARIEVPLQAHQGGQAELAVDRAADLGGNAQRVAGLLWNEDRLHAASVAHAQQVAHGPVLGFRTLDGRGQSAAVLPLELPPQAPRQRVNLFRTCTALAVEALVDLPAAVSRLAHRLCQFGQLVEIETDQRAGHVLSLPRFGTGGETSCRTGLRQSPERSESALRRSRTPARCRFPRRHGASCTESRP